jgi:hypothetical protein
MLLHRGGSARISGIRGLATIPAFRSPFTRLWMLIIPGAAITTVCKSLHSTFAQIRPLIIHKMPRFFPREDENLIYHHCCTVFRAVRTPIWAAAHMNQHTSIGMDFLQNGTGVGLLASKCGTMLSYVSKDGADFTTTIERDFLTSPQFNPTGGTWGRTNATCVVRAHSSGLPIVD